MQMLERIVVFLLIHVDVESSMHCISSLPVVLSARVAIGDFKTYYGGIVAGAIICSPTGKGSTRK